MDWDLLKTIVLGVFGIVVIVTTALLGLLIGSMRTLRDSNNDLRLRVSDLEKERADDKSENAALKTENGFLKSMVSGKVEWVALTDQLEEHHRQALAWWTKTGLTLGKILDALGRQP